jgi:cellulose biosynthesis protein BcsQ
MGLLALCSAKGSPGVSTLAVGVAALWPRPAVLVDLDPAGSDLIWRYRDERGEPLDPDRGLLSLGATVRRATATVDPQEHVQVLAGGLPIVAGVTHPDQVTGLGPVWPALADALTRWPHDVVADCGRVVPGSPTIPVLARADAVALVVRSGADGFAQLRERLRALTEALRLGRAGAVPTSVVLVTSDRDRHGEQDLQRLLDAERLGVQVLGRVAQDVAGAAALGGSWSPRVARSMLVRSVRALVPELDRVTARIPAT